MLLLKPFWIHGSVSFWVACGRQRITPTGWNMGTPLHMLTLFAISGVFIPVELWVITRNMSWESMFYLEDIHLNSTISTVVSMFSLVHVVVALGSYLLSVHLYQRYGA